MALTLKCTVASNNRDVINGDSMPHGEANTFGMMLKNLRAERKLSYTKLGQMVGVSHVTVRDWELGNRNPRRENVEALAAALDLPASALLDAAFGIERTDVVPIPVGGKVAHLRSGLAIIFPTDERDAELIVSAFDSVMDAIRGRQHLDALDGHSAAQEGGGVSDAEVAANQS